MVDQSHNLLKRQLKRSFGEADQYPSEIQSFVDAVNDAYIGYDSDLRMLERALELSSNELIQANSELRAIFQAFPDLLFRLDEEGKIIDFKGDDTQDKHLSIDELIGKDISALPNETLVKQFTEAIAYVHENKASYSMEYSFSDAPYDDYYEVRLIPLPDGHTIAIIRNITARKHAETALKESEQQLASIIDFLPDATFVIDLNGRIIAWNHAAEEATGKKASEMLGKGDQQYSIPFFGERRPMLADFALHPSDPVQQAYSEVVNEKEALHAETYASSFGQSGAYIWEKASLLYDSNQRIIGAVETVRDISERKLAEKALFESRKRLENQQAMLVELARSKTMYSGDLYQTISETCEAAAKTLKASRAGIWLYNEQMGGIVCANLYDRVRDSHCDGSVLKYSSFPEYFQALDRARIIAANDAVNDPRTRQLAEDYLIPNGIASTVDAPILLGGKTIGVICCEQIGSAREWTDDEQSFAGSMADIVSLAIEIAERKKAEADLRIRTSAMNAATDQIVITDVRGRVEFVNPSFERETDCTQAEVEGEMPDFLISDKHDADFYSALWETILGGQTWRGEVTVRRKDKSMVVEDVIVTPIKNDSGQIERFIAIKRNVTEKKAYEKQLDYLAHHDPLTGLPNRLQFSDMLTKCLAQAVRLDQIMAVLFLDLDQFKLINDTLGHSLGDLLLKSVSERLQNCIREADMIARMGGDEFTVILSNVASTDAVKATTERIVDALGKPYVLAGQELFVTVSIGVGMYPADGTDVETLVKNADSAMYRAKEQGRNNYQFYTNELNEAATERMHLELNLRRAVERNEFVLHYQPRVDVVTGRIIAAEALVRWRHPEIGLIPPAQFIPLAEETGLIVPISEWVVETACTQNRLWQDKGLDPITIAVNVSARQFRQDGLVEAVKSVLDKTGLAPDYLELELTESVLMHSIDLAVGILGRLKQMGVSISVDDFGTGYSSLTYLKRFPVDSVKIDQSFIRDLTTNPDDAAIARAVIAMSQSLKLNVIAEGVETMEQLMFLRSLECNEIQGYFVSRPVPAEDFEVILAESLYNLRGNTFQRAA